MINGQGGREDVAVWRNVVGDGDGASRLLKKSFCRAVGM
jgi:hypothetical protein